MRWPNGLNAKATKPPRLDNGAEGLVQLKGFKPDMILLDHMMPEVDGMTFLAGIRRFPKWKAMPVIMMTGLKDQAHHMKAQTLNVSEYLIKNEYAPRDLLEMIRKHLAPPPAVAMLDVLTQSPASH